MLLCSYARNVLRAAGTEIVGAWMDVCVSVGVGVSVELGEALKARAFF